MPYSKGWEGGLEKWMDWADGILATGKVITDNKPDLDVGNSWSRVRIQSRNAPATALIGPGQAIDGAVTKRAKKDTGEFRESLIYGYATALVGAPVILVRYYISGDETLQADDASLHADWQEVFFPTYISTDPTFIQEPFVSDATDPSGDIIAPLTSVRVRVLGYQLMAAGTAVNAGLEESTGATDLTPLWPFAANGGGVWPMSPNLDHFYAETADGQGVRIDKSAAQTVAGSVQARRHPHRLTAVAEWCVRLPPAKAVAVEIVNSAAAGNSLTFHIRHVGLS